MSIHEQFTRSSPIPRRASRPPEEVPPASHQRAGHYAGLHPEDTPETDTMDLTMLDWRAARSQKPSRMVYLDENDQEYDPDEEEDELRSRGLVRRSAIPLRDVPRRSRSVQVSYRRRASRERKTEEQSRPHRRLHWLVWVGVAMFILVLGYALLSNLFAWTDEQLDTLHYGYPRTAQYDAVVGHSDSAAHPSHFLALNLHGTVEVIEFPGGDASHAKVYVGPTLIGPNADKAVVTLSFVDVNGDGRPDMVIDVQGGHFVWLNTGTQFRQVTANDHCECAQSVKENIV